jgi:hypothetical protein
MPEQIQPQSKNPAMPPPLDSEETRSTAQRLWQTITNDVPEKGSIWGHERGCLNTPIQERVSELSQLLNHLQTLVNSFGYLDEDQRQGILSRIGTIEKEANYLSSQTGQNDCIEQLRQIKNELSRRTGTVWH